MSLLLSRYAEALFWFARYIERSASLARILNVQAGFWQDHSSQENWASILSLYADKDRFIEQNGQITTQKVAKFYITDRDNPGSILSCLWAARENGPPVTSADLCFHVVLYHNVSYNQMKSLSDRDLDASRLSRTCESIARTCDAIMGVTEGTYYRDAGWRFYQLGLWIERADQTSRLLDVKVAQVASYNGLDQTETVADMEFWKLLLHSFEAYHAFQRAKPGKLDPRKVANFFDVQPELPQIADPLHRRNTGYAQRSLYGLSAAPRRPML